MKIIIAIWIAIATTFYILYGALDEVSDYRDTRLKRIDKSIEEAQKFGRQLKSLSRVDPLFSKTFPDISEAKDIISLHQVLRLEDDGLLSNPLSLRVNQVEDIEVNGQRTGAQRICLSNGSGFSLISNSLDEVIEGAESLLARPWISAAGFRIRLYAGTSELDFSFDDFCTVFSDREYIKQLKGDI